MSYSNVIPLVCESYEWFRLDWQIDNPTSRRYESISPLWNNEFDTWEGMGIFNNQSCLFYSWTSNE